MINKIKQFLGIDKPKDTDTKKYTRKRVSPTIAKARYLAFGIDEPKEVVELLEQFCGAWAYRKPNNYNTLFAERNGNEIVVVQMWLE